VEATIGSKESIFEAVERETGGGGIKFLEDSLGELLELRGRG
jgi:hypothetical protein